MGRDGGRKGYEEEAEGPMVRDRYGTVDKGDPDHAYGDDLHPQRDGLVLHEIPDVGTKPRMVEKPVIERTGTAKEQCSSKKKERGRGKYRQENAENAKS